MERSYERPIESCGRSAPVSRPHCISFSRDNYGPSGSNRHAAMNCQPTPYRQLCANVGITRTLMGREPALKY